MLLSWRRPVIKMLICQLALLAGCATNSQNLAGFDLVRVPTDEGAVTTFRVTWFSGVDALATPSAYVEAESRAIQGTLFLTDRSVSLLVGGTPASRSGTGVHIRYSRIATIDIRHYLNSCAVVIRRRDGKVDSFQIRGAIFIDREQTEAAGRLLRSRVQATSLPVP